MFGTEENHRMLVLNSKYIHIDIPIVIWQLVRHADNRATTGTASTMAPVPETPTHRMPVPETQLTPPMPVMTPTTSRTPSTSRIPSEPLSSALVQLGEVRPRQSPVLLLVMPAVFEHAVDVLQNQLDDLVVVLDADPQLVEVFCIVCQQLTLPDRHQRHEHTSAVHDVCSSSFFSSCPRNAPCSI